MTTNINSRTILLGLTTAYFAGMLVLAIILNFTGNLGLRASTSDASYMSLEEKCQQARLKELPICQRLAREKR